MKTVIKLRFDGTNYCGWQIQPNARSIQQTVQDALEARYGSRFTLTGCSRTDSGVHANEFVAHITGLDEKYVSSLVSALNSSLPDDIAVTEAFTADDSFHARYSVREKQYTYLIFCSHIKDPFLSHRAYRTVESIDFERANELCCFFTGRHDFAAFMASGSKIRDTVRTVSLFEIRQDARCEGLWALSVRADGFLYNMVRIMAGTLLAAAEGRLHYSVPEIIEMKDRSNAGPTLPPYGLYLDKVFY